MQQQRIGRRCAVPWTLAVVASVSFLVSAPAAGQRLLSLVMSDGQPIVVGAPSSLPRPEEIAVQVDLDLLRGAPARLELPTPDGRMIDAELSVFEDRGDGDLMWAGGQRGAGYETVVLTVEGGRMAGRFGEAGGAVYRIGAGATGSGRMAMLAGPGLDAPAPYCSVDGMTDALPPRPRGAGTVVRSVDIEQRVAGAQEHETLDIVVLYTADAAAFWAERGGAEASIRNAGDYLNMTLRNGGIATPGRIVHMAEAPPELNRVGRDGLGEYATELNLRTYWNGEALRLRSEHRADIVHIFSGERPQMLDACGRAYLLTRGLTAEDFGPFAYSWTTSHPSCGDDAAIFAHEIGHNLGANHDPANVQQPSVAVHPYAFGHANFDRIPNIGTVMSYLGQVEPYLSSSRITIHGRTIGIADERDNERALRETIEIGVEYSDWVPSLDGRPAQPTGLGIDVSGESLVVTWEDNAPEADGYVVSYQQEDEDEPTTVSATDRTEATIGFDWAEPGSRYFFWVYALEGEVQSLRSSFVEFIVPGAAPEAPTDVSLEAWFSSTDFLLISWTDNSENEDGFEIRVFAGEDGVARGTLPADSTGALATDLTPGVEYSARIYAFNDGGYSEPAESEAAAALPPSPGPVAVSGLVATATGPTSVRLEWTDNADDEEVYIASAFVPGWYSSFAAVADAESFDMEGLARGGRYVFTVTPYNNDDGFGRGVSTGLTLGSLDAGPDAPTNLRWDVTREGALLAWDDNASSAAGFELQSRFPVPFERFPWSRVALLPAGATSSEVDRRQTLEYRVFAYDERGFSRSSNRLSWRPFERGALTAVPFGASGVELLWTDAWADTESDVLVVEARNPASYGWVELESIQAADGRRVLDALDADTPYTFRLRRDGEDGAFEYSDEASMTTGGHAGVCRDGEAYLCLQNGRFELQAHWSNPDVAGDYGGGSAAPVEISDESGLFWFFEPENIELVVKVLDGAGINGNYWVFFGALSDVEYWLTVTDTVSLERRTYHNQPKQVCGQKDLAAFRSAAAATAGSGLLSAGDLLEAGSAGTGIGPPGFEFRRAAGGTSRADERSRCERRRRRLRTGRGSAVPARRRLLRRGRLR